ncbi:MAG: SH3 domain-containing protein [Acidobacteria bacterium]|nr:SH3 domain-containing protein [Acidobacteriota bacterium]MBI3426473.1 SH3 domain-containing protein [Acidobacteriota bacterium]
MLNNETAFVAPEKIRLRSSTAEAARTVGELKSGDQVTITERKSEGNTAWANINGPGGVSGWVESKTLVKQAIVDAAQKIASEIQDIPTQAVGKSKARLKLRLTPDRNNDDNVAFELSAGAVLDIVARERQPRPEKLSAQQTAPANTAGNNAAAAGPKFDDWYKVRIKNLAIAPAGWIYGGSVELDVPGDIAFFTSTGQRITGWQKIGSTQDEQNQTKEHYLVAEKQLFGGDERLDFNRLKVLAFDPKRREYYTPFREDVSGRFPIRVKLDDKRGSFQVTALDKANQSHPIDYTFEFVENGRPKVTRVTPKESGKKR